MFPQAFVFMPTPCPPYTTANRDLLLTNALQCELGASKALTDRFMKRIFLNDNNMFMNAVDKLHYFNTIDFLIKVRYLFLYNILLPLLNTQCNVFLYQDLSISKSLTQPISHSPTWSVSHSLTLSVSQSLTLSKFHHNLNNDTVKK